MVQFAIEDGTEDLRSKQRDLLDPVLRTQRSSHIHDLSRASTRAQGSWMVGCFGSIVHVELDVIELARR